MITSEKANDTQRSTEVSKISHTIPVVKLIESHVIYCNSQGKTSTFKVQVRSDGGVFNEVVKINLKRKIEKFAVQSQDGFQAAEIIHDFRKVTSASCMLTSRVPILDVWLYHPFTDKQLSRSRLARKSIYRSLQFNLSSAKFSNLVPVFTLWLCDENFLWIPTALKGTYIVAGTPKNDRASETKHAVLSPPGKHRDLEGVGGEIKVTLFLAEHAQWCNFQPECYSG